MLCKIHRVSLSAGVRTSGRSRKSRALSQWTRENAGIIPQTSTRPCQCHAHDRHFQYSSCNLTPFLAAVESTKPQEHQNSVRASRRRCCSLRDSAWALDNLLLTLPATMVTPCPAVELRLFQDVPHDTRAQSTQKVTAFLVRIPRML